MDMDTIGYFLFMTEEERKEEADKNRSPEDYPTQTEEEPPQKTSGV